MAIQRPIKLDFYGQKRYISPLLSEGKPMDRRQMTLMLSDKEMTLLDQLAETRGMSKTALVRQALRLYQSVTERLENGEKVFVERPGSLEKTELMVL
jgi:ribbon-helix-helix CopG family protein